MEDYDIITRLGGGTFADVYQGLEKSTKTFVAIKTLKKNIQNGKIVLILENVNHFKNSIKNTYHLNQVIIT